MDEMKHGWAIKRANRLSDTIINMRVFQAHFAITKRTVNVWDKIKKCIIYVGFTSYPKVLTWNVRFRI